MEPLTLSIVTINYNNRSGLIMTLESVLAQTYRHIESIVIDGASTDGSVEYLQALERENLRFISEKDNGIYDAMQKGLSHIRGDAVIFLNSGDWFSSNRIVERIVERVDIGRSIVLGRTAQVMGEDMFIRPRLENLGELVEYPAHQGIVVPARIARRFQFDQRLLISADIDWARRCLGSEDCVLVPWIVSNVSLGGRSNSATLADLKKWVSEVTGVKRWIRMVKASVKFGLRLLVGRKWLYRILAWRKCEFTKLSPSRALDGDALAVGKHASVCLDARKPTARHLGTGSMITLFSIPRAFEGHVGVIQRNALESWRRLGPDIQIILFGSDPGVAEAANEFGARHVPEIALNEYSTPLVSDAFARVRSMAESPLVMYSNADLMYDRSLLESAAVVAEKAEFLMSGQCWDTNVFEDLAAAEPEAWHAVFAKHKARGRLRGPAGMDYFVFPRALSLDMPQFAVGRPGWDNWLVWYCLMKGVPVINATRSVIAIHQNPSYAGRPIGNQHWKHWKGPERHVNTRAAGGLAHMLTLREATWHLADGHLQRPPLFRRLPPLLAKRGFYQTLLALKRSL